MTLWGLKGKSLTPNISETVYNFAKRFSPKVGPLRALQNPPTPPGLIVPIWGSGEPNLKITFYPRNTSKKLLGLSERSCGQKATV